MIFNRSLTWYLRWLSTAAVFACQYIVEEQEQDYVWRRLANSQQQAERQKKNIIQLSVLFHGRAETIHKDPWYVYYAGLFYRLVILFECLWGRYSKIVYIERFLTPASQNITEAGKRELYDLQCCLGPSDR